MQHRDIWDTHATQWDRLGPPLRPSAPDLASYNRALQRFVKRHGAPRALALGATPELAGLAWPPGTELAAMDRSLDMLQRVWPGFPRPGEGTLHADWCEMPLPDNSRDVVISDGCFGVLRYPDRHRRLLEIVHRLLSPHGLFVFRVFCRPDESESPDAVFAAVMAGDLQSLHAFKLRLLMAVQNDTNDGACTGDVWNVWNERGPGAERLAAQRGWSPQLIATIDSYRGLDTRYHFPSLAELSALWTAAGFTEVDRSLPDYELGERCPMLVLAPAQSG